LLAMGAQPRATIAGDNFAVELVPRGHTIGATGESGESGRKTDRPKTASCSGSDVPIRIDEGC
jgi:hypothetical protein